MEKGKCTELKLSITKVFYIDQNNPDLHLLNLAAIKLLEGGLIAFPTETVYGLGANAFNKEAIDGIFRAKKRPVSDPIIVHIFTITQLKDVASCIPDLAWKLAEEFWPGPLTFVLKRHPRLPSNISAGLDTAAVRMPNHKVVQSLLELAKVPIAAPSANLFTRPSSTLAQHVLEDLNGKVDIILDSGPTSIGLESTVIDLTQEIPTVLRPGGIQLNSLRKIIPFLKLDPKYIKLNKSKEVSSSPGMLLKHYAPKAKLILYTGEPVDRVTAHMIETALQHVKKGKKVGVLTTKEEYVYYKDLPVNIFVLGSVCKIEEIAHKLFIGMRELDNKKVDIIIVRSFSNEGLGLAVWDRLFRAAEGNIINVTF